MGIRIYADWDITINLSTEEQVDVLIDRFDYSPVPDGVIRIVVIQEPYFNLITPVMQYPDSYSYVLTYHQELLDNIPKARYFIALDPWVYAENVKTKRFAVSSIVGGKRGIRFPGYAIRHALWDQKKHITIPHEIYLSTKFKLGGVNYNTYPYVIDDQKQPAFDCMFHIVIENVFVRNCFSEKLTDCFYTKTIPIYCGAPNIGDFFNIDGILVCNTIKDIIRTCNGLTPDVYWGKIAIMEDNFERCKKYLGYDEILKRAIMTILEERRNHGD